jgi:hypothetical protein
VQHLCSSSISDQCTLHTLHGSRSTG